MKKIFKYICVYAGVLAVLMLALWASTKLPQARIDRNIEKSFILLNEEGPYAYVLDGRPTSMLDNYTDTITLTVCKSSGPQEKQSFLTNPFFGGDDVLGNLGKYCVGEVVPESYYVRYWIGSRIFLRPLLEVADMQYIRYATITLTFVLFALAVLSIGRNLSVWSGLAFVIGIYLIRPYICARCLQYACCPLIALLAVLAVPLIERKLDSYPMFFMVVGIVTMFFDFYTVPILTFGLPMIYLMSLRAKNGMPMSIKDVLLCLAGWGAGYLLTWLVKMALVDIFTEYAGFSNGFSELRMWLRKSPETSDAASAYIKAFAALRKVIVPDMKTGIIMTSLLTAVTAVFIYRVRKGETRVLKANAAMLVVGLLPLLWFAAATKPITNHAFFQYRSIAVTYWAIGAWVAVPKVRRVNVIFNE